MAKRAIHSLNQFYGDLVAGQNKGASNYSGEALSAIYSKYQGLKNGEEFMYTIGGGAINFFEPQLLASAGNNNDLYAYKGSVKGASFISDKEF